MIETKINLQGADAVINIITMSGTYLVEYCCCV